MIKYLILAIAIFVLWVTEPIWRTSHITGHTIVPTEHEPDNITTETYQDQKKTTKPRTEAEKRYIADFGEKPSIDFDSDTPYTVKSYWKKVYKHPERILPLSCTHLKMTPRGWKTTCNFKTQEHSTDVYELQQETYYIKNGTVNDDRSKHVSVN